MAGADTSGARSYVEDKNVVLVIDLLTRAQTEHHYRDARYLAERVLDADQQLLVVDALLACERRLGVNP
jgi:hypothetical protein